MEAVYAHELRAIRRILKEHGGDLAWRVTEEGETPILVACAYKEGDVATLHTLIQVRPRKCHCLVSATCHDRGIISQGGAALTDVVVREVIRSGRSDLLAYLLVRGEPIPLEPIIRRTNASMLEARLEVQPQMTAEEAEECLTYLSEEITDDTEIAEALAQDETEAELFRRANRAAGRERAEAEDEDASSPEVTYLETRPPPGRDDESVDETDYQAEYNKLLRSRRHRGGDPRDCLEVLLDHFAFPPERLQEAKTYMLEHDGASGARIVDEHLAKRAEE